MVDYLTVLVVSPISGIVATFVDYFALTLLPIRMSMHELQFHNHGHHPNKSHLGKFAAFTLSSLTYNFFFMIFKNVFKIDIFWVVWVGGAVAIAAMTAPFIIAIGSYTRWRKPFIWLVSLDWMGIILSGTAIAAIWLTPTGASIGKAVTSVLPFYNRWWNIITFVIELGVYTGLVLVLDRIKRSHKLNSATTEELMAQKDKASQEETEQT